MKVPNNSSKEDKSIRLYRNLISSIRLIGIMGGFGAFIFSFFVAAESELGDLGGLLVLIFTFTSLVFFLYVVTQSSVAIIDLLSRIEFSTRQH